MEGERDANAQSYKELCKVGETKTIASARGRPPQTQLGTPVGTWLIFKGRDGICQ